MKYNRLSKILINTALFPEIANTGLVWVKLAKNGDQKKVRDAYEKALTLKPDLLSAKMALEKMSKSLNPDLLSME